MRLIVTRDSGDVDHALEHSPMIKERRERRDDDDGGRDGNRENVTLPGAERVFALIPRSAPTLLIAITLLS